MSEAGQPASEARELLNNLRQLIELDKGFGVE